MYRASHSRYFWGLRLHLLSTLMGLPVGFALTGATADERQVLLDILADPVLIAGRAGRVIFAERNYYGHDFEAALADGRIRLPRPAYDQVGTPSSALTSAPLTPQAKSVRRGAGTYWRVSGI